MPELRHAHLQFALGHADLGEALCQLGTGEADEGILPGTRAGTTSSAIFSMPASARGIGGGAAGPRWN